MNAPEIAHAPRISALPRHPLALPSLLLCGAAVLGFFIPYYALWPRSGAALLALLTLALLHRPASRAGLTRSWRISLAGFALLTAAPLLALAVTGWLEEAWAVSVPLAVVLILLYLAGLWGLGTFCGLMAGLCRAEELPKSAKLWTAARRAVLFFLLPGVAIADAAPLVGVKTGIAWLLGPWGSFLWFILIYTGLHLLVASVLTRVEAQGAQDSGSYLESA